MMDDGRRRSCVPARGGTDPATRVSAPRRPPSPAGSQSHSGGHLSTEPCREPAWSRGRAGPEESPKRRVDYLGTIRSLATADHRDDSGRISARLAQAQADLFDRARFDDVQGPTVDHLSAVPIGGRLAVTAEAKPSAIRSVQEQPRCWRIL